MGAIKELLALRGYIKQRSSPGTRYYLENRKRRILPGLFSGSLFAFVFSDENAYEAYADFFAVHPGAMDYPATPKKQSGLRILVIADARQKERNLDDGVIKKIADYYKEGGNSVTTAFFRQRKPSVTNEVEVYGDFQTLVALIKRYDIIVGADSMPVHLAQFFRKPHYILHPSHVKDQFFTPFSMKHKTHFTFEEIASRNSFLPDA
ncbi:hypothetical protein GWC95_04220 [Sediminibacterium roseum]|uniref:Glycosyltransferase family 9 (Heptosyltransferase) n=1 Tax=Sediminibacterium roseum TaxID=1978412 RepID=A0ABW9ZVP1_9BACT|nr:hypothetical protein [Sediminibacterium roseum]NCI49115.1 hypothetical protein [Sediminibacterium roseum]